MFRKEIDSEVKDYDNKMQVIYKQLTDDFFE